MNTDVFYLLINSNYSLLISHDLYESIHYQMGNFLFDFYEIFIRNLNIKEVLLNKNDFNYYRTYSENTAKVLKCFLHSDNYNNNRAFEKLIIKCVLYTYCLSVVVLLFMTGNNEDIQCECFDNLLNEFTKVCGIFYKLNSVELVLKIHEYVKGLVGVNKVDELLKHKEEWCLSYGKELLFNIRKHSLKDTHEQIRIMINVDVSIEEYVKAIGLIILINVFKINIDDGSIRIQKSICNDNEQNILQFIEDKLKE